MSQGFEKTPQQIKLLRAERRKRGWTQRFVADQLGTTELSVSRWERGETTPRAYYQHKLCELFDLSPLELDLDGCNLYEKDTGFVAKNSILIDTFLPPLTHTLIGRDVLLEQIKSQICIPHKSSCTALYGLPGVGKTALAIALAHDLDIQAHFNGGIFWVSATSFCNIEETIIHWGNLLGIFPSELIQLDSIPKKIKAICSTIGIRRALFIIDNVPSTEHILFNIGGPHCSYLLTTRFPHVAIDMAPSNSIAISELSVDNGTRLLLDLAPRVLEYCSLDVVHTLINMVGSLPLALVLIGWFLQRQLYGNQPRRLQQAICLLHDTHYRMKLTRPQHLFDGFPGDTTMALSLQVALDDIVNCLGRKEQLALFALSQFPPRPASFSEEAALLIARCSTATLDNLSDVGLLISEGSGFYSLHKVVADYASLCMGRSGFDTVGKPEISLQAQ